jgi:hypothetical protein
MALPTINAFKNYMKSLYPVLLFGFLLSSCYYDNEEELYPNSQTCDTSNAKYSTVVKPILDLRCNGCHSGAGASAGIDLSTHANVALYAASGSLIGVMEHQSGFSPMPKSAPKMPECEIKKVKAWVGNGAPNN